MPVDLPAIYHASDLGDQMAPRIRTVIERIELRANIAATDPDILRLPWEDSIAAAKRSPMFPWADLEELFNLKTDALGIVYGFTQAQIVATGKEPYQWGADEAGAINVRNWLNMNLVLPAEAALTRWDYTGRHARNPYYSWDAEMVRRETVESLEQAGADLITPAGGWKLEHKLMIAGVVIGILGLLFGGRSQ